MLREIFGEVNELVSLALTHPSYTQENNLSSLKNYERLEFFGDSVLKLFTSKILYEIYPELLEGELSKIRSILVSDMILSKVALAIKLNELIKLGPAEEKCGGRLRESNLACSLEAVLGAYYLSGENQEIEDFIRKYIIIYADDVNKHFAKYNAKDILQQYTQSIDKSLPLYKTIEVKGPAHKPEFVIEVSWQNKILAQGIGKTKKEAQQNAALKACQKLKIIDKV